MNSHHQAETIFKAFSRALRAVANGRSALASAMGIVGSVDEYKLHESGVSSTGLSMSRSLPLLSTIFTLTLPWPQFARISGGRILRPYEGRLHWNRAANKYRWFTS